jgi:hypothetical protein
MVTVHELTVTQVSRTDHPHPLRRTGARNTIAFMRFPLSSVLLVTALVAQTPHNFESIYGKWHLLQASDDEVNVPGHRVDLVFRGEQNVLSGAVINRSTGEDIPLASLKFDGNILTLQMAITRDSVPTILTMTSKGGKFEGYWMRGATEIGPMLKLVRFR